MGVFLVGKQKKIVKRELDEEKRNASLLVKNSKESLD